MYQTSHIIKLCQLDFTIKKIGGDNIYCGDNKISKKTKILVIHGIFKMPTIYNFIDKTKEFLKDEFETNVHEYKIYIFRTIYGFNFARIIRSQRLISNFNIFMFNGNYTKYKNLYIPRKSLYIIINNTDICEIISNYKNIFERIIRETSDGNNFHDDYDMFPKKRKKLNAERLNLISFQ